MTFKNRTIKEVLLMPLIVLWALGVYISMPRGQAALLRIALFLSLCANAFLGATLIGHEHGATQDARTEHALLREALHAALQPQDRAVFHQMFVARRAGILNARADLVRAEMAFGRTLEVKPADAGAARKAFADLRQTELTLEDRSYDALVNAIANLRPDARQALGREIETLQTARQVEDKGRATGGEPSERTTR